MRRRTPARAAGGGEALRQAHVDALELGFAAVQDGDEIDHRIGVAQHPRQRRVVVDVADLDLDRRQQLEVARPREVPRRDADPAVGAARALDQLFADAAADEAGRAEDEDLEHV